MNWAFGTDEMRVFEELAKHMVIPRNYLVFDVETLGFGKDIPIAQVGWGVVNDCRLLNVESLLLNWSDPQYGLDEEWIRNQIDRITQQMADQGKTYCTTYERMCMEGLDPVEVIQVYVELIESYINEGMPLVAHNGWMFDRKRVDHHCEQFFDRKVHWPPNAIFDTGMVEKAAQMNRPPHTGETLDEWYSRVYGGRSTIKWSLEGHCMPKYRLAERYGLDPLLAHDAGYDCRITHALFETYREIAEAFIG
jgi:DNA polymerase III epsilon subunit-like protein